MKKTQMLKKNYEYKYVFKKGQYYSGKYIEIFCLKNNYSKNRLGIAISKKITKSVKRNRIKRLIRENYRLFEKDLKIGNSIIILWKKKADIEFATFENIKIDMLKIFEKAEILEADLKWKKLFYFC